MLAENTLSLRGEDYAETAYVSAMQCVTKRIIVAFLFILLAFALGRFAMPSFSTRWRGIKDGMTQEQVRKVLGNPSWTGPSGTIGAGNRAVTRWGYKRGLGNYYVDFDYIGPGGAPLVFRTERYEQDWEELWWRLRHPYSRA